MKPQAHLVYGDHDLVRTDGHLIYFRGIRAEGDCFWKLGQSLTSFADSVELMKKAEWIDGSSQLFSQVGWGNENDIIIWSAMASCLRIDLSLIAPNMIGETALRLQTYVSRVRHYWGDDEGDHGEDSMRYNLWRLGLITSNAAAPDVNWNWLDSAPSVTGNAIGWVTLAENLVLQRYVYMLMSMEVYTEITFDEDLFFAFDESESAIIEGQGQLPMIWFVF